VISAAVIALLLLGMLDARDQASLNLAGILITAYLLVYFYVRKLRRELQRLRDTLERRTSHTRELMPTRNRRPNFGGTRHRAADANR